MKDLDRVYAKSITKEYTSKKTWQVVALKKITNSSYHPKYKTFTIKRFRKNWHHNCPNKDNNR